MTKEKKETGLEVVGTSTGIDNLAVPDNVNDGLDTITGEDIVVPRITLNDKKHPGVIYCDATGDEWEDGNFALIRLVRQRVMWPEKFSKDNEPVCKSNDGISPASDINSPPDERCEDCPMQTWGENNEPPACKKVFQMLLLNIDEMIPCWYAAASKAYTPTRKLVTALKLKSRKFGGSPAFFFQFTMTPNFIEGDSGDYYIPSYGAVSFIDDTQDRAIMLEIASDLAKEKDADAGDKAEEVPF